MNKKGTRALASATVVGLVLATVATSNVQAAPGKVDRLGGSNRYQTAANVATKNWAKADNVILVSGEGYADALSASLLAQKLDAPVLLTGKDGLDADTNKAIQKLGAKNVYILGSKGVVSENVKGSLEKSGKKVTRLAGSNRYETNVAIANELVNNHGVKADDVLVVNGNGYLADALTAAPVAAKEGKILLLVGEDLSTSKEAKKFIDAHKSKVTVIGRDVTVSDAMYKELGATKRVNGGKDRFETNRLVLQAFGLKGSHLYVANGQDNHLVDSLVASAIAGKFQSPVVLVSNDDAKDAKAVEYIKANANEKTDLNVVGSEAILSDKLVEEINNSVNPELVAAEKAVKAYEDAKITNLEEINAAKALKAEAVKAVDSVKDAAKKEAFEARIAAHDKVVAEAEAKLAVKVESVTAINETAVQVKGLAKEVKEKDLVGKKITLKAGDAELTATYVATSLTEDGKANFVLGSEKKLTDAVTYKVSAKWASFMNDTFMAKGLKAPYVNKVEVITKNVPAMKYVKEVKGAESGVTKIYFTAKNQYGEDIILTEENVKKLGVKATLNGVPMLSTEVVDENAKNGYIEIKKTLAEGNKVLLTLTNNINDKDVEIGSASYTVVKEAKPVATTVTDMKAIYDKAENNHIKDAEAKEVMPGDTIKLTAKVNDQFGNPMDEEKVRWVVEEGKDLIKGLEDVKDAKEVTFTASEAGKLKISAYIGNGKKATFERVIGAKELKELILKDEKDVDFGKLYNQDENTLKVVTPNSGANLTADMIKFDVKATKTSVDVTPADVKVTAKVRGGKEDNKNDIVIVAKSTKPGKYTITPYVGESLEKATGKVAGFDVITTIDQTVTSIDDIAFDALELKTRKEIKKDVTFRNKHNEVVVLENGAAGLNIVTTPVIKNENGQLVTVTKDDKANKNILTLKVNEAKAYNLVIQKSDVIKSFNLKFADATFTKVDAGSDITGVVAGDPNTKAKDQAIKFLDQDGKEMPVKASDLTVSITGPTGATVTPGDLVKLASNYGFDKYGKDQFYEATVDKIVKGFRVQPVKDLAQGVYTVKIANNDADKNLSGKIYDTFTVTVGAKREAKTIDITPASTNVALNGKVKVKVTPKDQYGEFIVVGAENIAVNAGDNFTAGAVTEINKDGGAVTAEKPVAAYEVTLTGKTKGTNDIEVNINGKDKEDKDIVLATNKVSMTVDSVANLVNSVSIDTKDVAGKAIEPLYSTEKEAATVELKPIAKDVNGAIVPVADEDLNWSIVSVRDKEGKEIANKIGKTENKIVSVDKEGKVTIAKEQVGSVVVKVQTSNMKTATITLNFDKVEAVAKTGTTSVVNNIDKMIVDADEAKPGIQIALDGVGDKDGEADGAITLKLDAKDQYGKDVKDIKTGIVALADDTSVVTSDVKDGVITITSKAVGTSNVFVQYNGDTIKLEVSVNDKAVKAVADKITKDNAKAANLVINQIEKLPKKDDVKIENKEDVKAARKAYDNLTKDQKKLVENITKLTEAEAKISELEGAAEEDNESVSKAKSVLKVTTTAGDTDLNNVKNNVTLSEATEETNIVWVSSDADVVTNNGTVKRPSYSAGHKDVKLTATITKGHAKETKVFDVKVLKKDFKVEPSEKADKTFTIIGDGYVAADFNVANIDMDSEKDGVQSSIQVNGLTYTVAYDKGKATVTVEGNAKEKADATTKAITVTKDSKNIKLNLNIPGVEANAESNTVGFTITQSK